MLNNLAPPPDPHLPSKSWSSTEKEEPEHGRLLLRGQDCRPGQNLGPWVRWIASVSPFTSLPNLHRRIAEIASGANGASEEAGAGIPESQRYFLPRPSTASQTCSRNWVRTATACPGGEKSSRSLRFKLGEGLAGGGSRGEGGREQKMGPGEEAVLNSSHLINLHR